MLLGSSVIVARTGPPNSPSEISIGWSLIGEVLLGAIRWQDNSVIEAKKHGWTFKLLGSGDSSCSRRETRPDIPSRDRHESEWLRRPAWEFRSSRNVAPFTFRECHYEIIATV